MRRLAASLFLISSLVAGRSRAEEAPRIAVVHDSAADQRTIVRLRSELSTLGLRVVEVPLAPDEGASSLDDAARRVGAFAAVRVVPARGGVEVWVADRVTGKTLLRELVVGPGDAVDDVVALQAVELLRASLAELGLPSRPHGDVQPSPVVARIVPPISTPTESSRRLLVQIGPGVALSPGGFGATGHGFVGLRWRPALALGLDAWALFPISSSSTEDKEGSAALSPLLLGVDVAWWVFDPGEAWQLTGGVGMALARLAIDGRARPPFSDREDPLTLAVVTGRVSVGRRLGSRLGLDLDGFAGVAIPEPVVRFGGRKVADWGRPLVAAVISFDVSLD